MRNKKKLLLDQLDQKTLPFQSVKQIQVPEKGWINNIRVALNMTMNQLGLKLNKTRQGVKQVEESEAKGSISIKSLKEVAKALDLEFVYGFVPKQNNFNELVSKKSNELAKKIVLRTNQNMKLEDQGIAEKKLEEAIKDLAEDIKREMRKSLWD